MFTDPYTLQKRDLVDNIEFCPNISYPDIVNYLLFVPNLVTSEELKNYKSLEAYNHFVCGWLKQISLKLFEDGQVCLLIGRVNIAAISKCRS